MPPCRRHCRTSQIRARDDPAVLDVKAHHQLLQVLSFVLGNRRLVKERDLNPLLAPPSLLRHPNV